METWQYVLIAVGVIVVGAIIAFVLYKLVGSKNSNVHDKDKVKEDREIIEANSKAIEALVVLADDNDEMKNELKELQEKLKYLVPSGDFKVIDGDKKIKNLIGDLRIALTKSDGDDSKKVERNLQEIKLAVADRNARV